MQHWSEVLQWDSWILLLEQKDLGKLHVTPLLTGNLHRCSDQRSSQDMNDTCHAHYRSQSTSKKSLKLNTYSKRPKAAVMKAMRHRTQEAPSLTCPIFSYSQMLLRSRLVPILHRSTTEITSVRSGNWRKILS